MKQFLSKKFDSPLFDTKQIFSMLTPLIMDSFFVCAIGVLTTAMISSSSQDSVSAVSLVSPLYMMIYAVYNAISAGGTVVVAQFKGKGDTERMKKAAGQLMVATPLSAVIACAILVIFADPLVHGLFGGVGEEVLAKAEQYLVGIAISMIFLAVYMSGFAVFRGLGETKLCLRLTIIINLLHFVASFVFINVMRLDIMGSALALNLALFYAAPGAVATLAVTVIGQCIGSGDKELARRYGRSMVWLCTALTVVSLIVGLPLMPLILKMYQAPDNTVAMIYSVLAIAAVCMPFFWPVSNTLPAVMRSAGDASYASYFSLVTMWVVRVALGYVLAVWLGLGIQGVWIGMCAEWAVKTLAFWKRFRGDKWLAHEQDI